MIFKNKSIMYLVNVFFAYGNKQEKVSLSQRTSTGDRIFSLWSQVLGRVLLPGGTRFLPLT